MGINTWMTMNWSWVPEKKSWEVVLAARIIIFLRSEDVKFAFGWSRSHNFFR